MPLAQASFHTFLVQPTDKNQARLFILLAPPPKRLSPAGRLFILAEYSPLLNQKDKLLSLFNQIVHHYDEQSKEETENAFESTIEWANRIFNQKFAPELKTAFDASLTHYSFLSDLEHKNELNCLVGCLKDKHLQFVLSGQISGYIIFKQEENYRLLDLIKTYHSPAEKDDIFFANLISGELQDDNLVIFCTSQIFDFITTDRLQKILLSRPLEEACRYLEQTLRQIKNNLSFGGMLISLVKQFQKMPKERKTILLPRDSSIRQLVRREKETEEILSPSLWSTLKKFWERRKEERREKIKPEKQDLETIRRITKIYNRLTGWQGKIKNFSKTAAENFFQFFFRAGLLFKKPAEINPASSNETLDSAERDKKNWGDFFKNLAVRLKSLALKLVERVWQKLLAIPAPKRYFLLGTIFLAIVLAASLGGSAIQNHRRLEKQKYNELLNNIKDKLDRAESSLIYKNEEEALLILTEAKKEMSVFPQNSKNRREMFKKLTADFNLLRQKTQHLEFVEPDLIADLNQYNLNCQPKDLFKIKSIYFFFCPQSFNLFYFDEKSKNFAPLSSPFLGEIKDKFVIKENGVIFLNGANRLTQLNPEDFSFSPLEIVWPKNEVDVRLIAAYRNYLYAIDLKNNQISKHQKSSTGFAKGSFWLKEKMSLSEAMSLAIDGSIYLAKTNGEIWRLENGLKKDFNLSFIEPPLSSAGRIFTAPDSPNLFLLDAGQKRVIIWDKSKRKLKAQFTSDKFDDLRDFNVDERNKTIFLLNGTKIFSIKY